ncbi:pentapeptide repeat-containing protein [Leptolyngbya boryana CZ1]|uniref:Pentapeptide repeat-containing protein n=1 Tax=Leptolyngbya boryana CZ1 TaxID=3060204 RepID=A0AA96X1B4_LEPBY|nr:pentapeptide repeat-containing protein [Leptolyngbya boryana]WNZ49212.1 pentapeptide repeat-containing protein [Leptolyngbya boryana CZ1]
MAGANLPGANLSGADLRKANLHGANLRETYFGWSDFGDYFLEGADLTEADLRGANLSGANFEDAFGGLDLQNIIWNESTDWENVQGLETAQNVPIALKQQLGLE